MRTLFKPNPTFTAIYIDRQTLDFVNEMLYVLSEYFDITTVSNSTYTTQLVFSKLSAT